MIRALLHNRRLNRIPVLLGLLLLSLTAFAQSYESSVEIYFRLGSSAYEPFFKSNQPKVKSFVSDGLDFVKCDRVARSDHGFSLETVLGGGNCLINNILPFEEAFCADVRYPAGSRLSPVEPDFPSQIARRESYPSLTLDQMETDCLEGGEQTDWRRQISLKTNTVAWALLMGNLAVEVDLNRNVSLNLPVWYSAIDYFKSTVKFRTFAVQPELRWNFDKPDGLYVGSHFGLAYFNLAANGKYRIQTRNGDEPIIGGGLSAGYRIPLSDDGKWKLELGLGAGAYRFNYDKFFNEPNGAKAGSVCRTYIGVDNASVSVSYSFDLGRRTTK